MPSDVDRDLVAVDIGNGRIKLGFFPAGGAVVGAALPEPRETLTLPILDRGGRFDSDRLREWPALIRLERVTWLVSSVHRGAAERFIDAVATRAKLVDVEDSVRKVACGDISLPLHVDQPERVGVDRLLAALAADWVRPPDRPAVVVDLGTAITVDLVDSAGAFRGGAILPGIAISARALADHTDALPHVSLNYLEQPVPPVGRSTVEAIHSGLFWGAVGAIRELVQQYSQRDAVPPVVFLTGGASLQVANLLAAKTPKMDFTPMSVRHLPNLVLSGIAIANQSIEWQ